MNLADFNATVDGLKQSSDEQRNILAAVYGDILQGIGPAVAKAAYTAQSLSPSVRGVEELAQLLHIMDGGFATCLLYTSPSPRDRQKSRMPSSA